jgi:periplasmic divalent cation tolerance protein
VPSQRFCAACGAANFNTLVNPDYFQSRNSDGYNAREPKSHALSPCLPPVTAIRLVFTTLPDLEVADKLAKNLVEKRLAACVNILSACQSVYRWQDAVQVDGEVPLIIKTTEELYPALETYIRQQHPYALPEIVALAVVQGLPEYLNWVAASTGPALPQQVPTGV